MKEKELERTLKALANKRRLAILSYIKKQKEASVGEIADNVKLSLKAASKHLGILAAASIVDREQVVFQGIYRINDTLSEPARLILALL